MIINELFHVLYETFQRLCCSLVHEASDQGYSYGNLDSETYCYITETNFLQGLPIGYSLQPTNHFTCYIKLHTV